MAGKSSLPSLKILSPFPSHDDAVRMATISELTDLFSNLAARIRSGAGQEHPSPEILDPSISRLSESLNLTDVGSVRVLDTALSLLCFTAPKVFDTTIHYTADTITSVLSSSVSCKALTLERGDALQIGSSISQRDCLGLIKFVAEAFPMLASHGVPWDSLLRAVVRVAALSSNCKCLPSLKFSFDLISVEERSNGLSKLLQHLSKEAAFSLKDHELPLRLYMWHVDPLTLKNDISTILQESVERPFLCLSKEFNERTDWRCIVLSLVLSPVMFINSRALLHDWFLHTGLISILELLAELVFVILNILTRPTWWDISMGMSLNLLFLKAYFPYWNHMSRTLAGPLSCEIFLQLVNDIGKKVNHDRRQLVPEIRSFAAKLLSVDHKSIWALAINFPDWFYFASFLLFSENSCRENPSSGWPFSVIETGQTNCSDRELASSAAKYIAWILSPGDKHNEDLLFDGLTKISLGWKSNEINSDPRQRATTKLKKSKFSHNKSTKQVGYDNQFIFLFLKDFQSMLMAGEEATKYSEPAEAESSHVPQHHLLFRRVLLGIVIGSHRNITEDGCQQLLHYAATGTILHPQMSNSSTINRGKGSLRCPKDGAIDNSGWSKNDAAAGACLVFSVTDIVERMTASLCKTEETGVEMTCQFKLRTSGYLFECVKKVTQVTQNTKGDMQMLTDILYRLETWKNQGKEMLQLRDGLDFAMGSLRSKLSPI